jgi:flagellar biosynthetic protein FlhB
MSDANDAASRTEEPTPRKLQQAREKGDVAKTPDLAPLASLAAAAAVIALAGGRLSQNLATALLPFIARPDAFDLQGGAGVEVARLAMLAAAPVLFAVLFAAALAGAAGNLVQHGFLYAPEKLKPDLKRLSLPAGFKRIFGVDGFVQFLKSVLKIAVVAFVAWWAVKPSVSQFETLTELDPTAMLPFCAGILRRLVFAVAGLLLVIAALDWMWQRQRFMARMRMSKEELKEDYKQTEGDPHVRARQRQIRNERARRRMMQAVPTATVVVMNPTHFAVALKYEPSETPAPMCVAKGVDSLALKIREVAEAAGVPIVEDAPLARSLYAAVEIDDVIPPKHYEAVARVIGFILNAGRRSPAHSL